MSCLDQYLRQREIYYGKSGSTFRSQIKQSSHLVEKLTLAHNLTGHQGCVNTILFSEDGNIVYTGSDDTKVNIYDVDTGTLKTSISTRHTNNIFYVKDLPYSQGSKLVSCAADGRVLLTDLEDNSTIQLFKHQGRAHRISIIPNSPSSFYSCGNDGKCCFFDVRTLSQPSNGTPLSDSSGSGRSRGRFVVLDDASISKTVFKNAKNQNASVYCIHVNPMKPNEIAIVGSSQYVAIYDVRKFDSPCVQMCPDHLVNSSEHVTGVKFNYSGNLIVASYNDEDIYTLDVTKHSKSDHPSPNANDLSSEDKGYVHRFQGHRNNDTVKQVAFFGSRSDWVVSGSDCGHIFLWNTKTGELAKMLHGDPIGAINCFDGHPHYPILASSGLDHDAKLWAPSGERERIIRPVDNVSVTSSESTRTRTSVHSDPATSSPSAADDEVIDEYTPWRKYQRVLTRNIEERDSTRNHGNTASMSSSMLMNLLQAYMPYLSDDENEPNGNRNASMNQIWMSRNARMLLRMWAASMENDDDDDDNDINPDSMEEDDNDADEDEEDNQDDSGSASDMNDTDTLNEYERDCSDCFDDKDDCTEHSENENDEIYDDTIEEDREEDQDFQVDFVDDQSEEAICNIETVT